MCLEIVVTLAADAETSVSARSLAGQSGLVVKDQVFEGKKSLQLSRAGGCSCDFLSDAADFDAEHWALEPEALPAFGAAAAHLARVAKRFSVVAHWLGGDRPRRSVHIGAAAFERLVLDNRVGNNVLYHVGQCRQGTAE